jgi:hypothetical protein
MPIRRRRPLLRAAAVGGGAYYMGKRNAESQERAAPGASPPAPAPADGASQNDYSAGAPAQSAGGLSEESLRRLKELAQLHEQGVLTDEELATQKARILG